MDMDKMNNQDLPIEKQLDIISKWLNENQARIKEKNISLSFVHFSPEEGGTRCNCLHMLTTSSMIKLCDLCLTSLKEMIDPDEKDYSKFLMAVMVMFGALHPEMEEARKNSVDPRTL